ncbi:MAG: pentapeptide repeat-containing protein, partial [Thermoleophilia bacterium]|nr:pentapeptide repeat-containing protein [Thermoleophilia bacterium]
RGRRLGRAAQRRRPAARRRRAAAVRGRVSEQLDFVDERLVGPDLSNAAFGDCRLDLTAFPLARLRRVTFEDCRLDGAHFRELTDVRFERCDLTHGDFSNARCARTQIKRRALDGLGGPPPSRASR